MKDSKSWLKKIRNVGKVSMMGFAIHPLNPTPAQTTRSISQGSASIARAINHSSSTRSFVDGLLASSLSLVLLIPVFLETSERLIDFRERYNPSSVILSAFQIRKIAWKKMYSDFLNIRVVFCPTGCIFVPKIGNIGLKLKHMVALHENSIIITIPTPNPAQTLAEIQSGIIEMMKTILTSGSEDKDLELDRPTANGGYFVLEFLQATLSDPARKVENPARIPAP